MEIYLVRSILILPRTQTEGEKETTGFACRLYPSHGPSWFITSHSFRARLCQAKNEAPDEEANTRRLKRTKTAIKVYIPHEKLCLFCFFNVLFFS